MRAFTSDELIRMQGTQEEAMMDTCQLVRLFITDRVDEYGMPVKEWVEEISVCGLDMDPRPEYNAPAGGGDETQVEAGEAVLRLPIDCDITNLDRVRITHRFGMLLDEPLVYDAGQPPRRGPSGLTIRVRLATHE
jgi:hypothetical protein